MEVNSLGTLCEAAKGLPMLVNLDSTHWRSILSMEKLHQRFRESGLANPTYEDRIQQTKRRVPEKTPSPVATP